MATSFIGGTRTVWEALSNAFGKGAKAHVAVAFVGSGAGNLLLLKRGSVLVANVSDSALQTGQTDPSVLLRLLKKGVRIYGSDNLHAKVFVFAKSAFVGSANASTSAANRLTEGVIRTTDSEVIAQARQFVISLAERELGPQTLKALQTRYRPPKFPLFGARHNQQRDFIWCVDIDATGYSPAAEAASAKGLPKAKKKLRDSKRFKIDEFQWTGRKRINQIAIRQEILRRIRDGKAKFVYPLATIVHRERFKEGPADSEIVFLEVPKFRKKAKWPDVRAQFRDLFDGNGVTKAKSRHQIRLIRQTFGSALNKK